MLTLVKTMKTMCLSGKIDWDIINKQVMGVHQLDDTTMGMVFENPEYGTTRIFSTNHSKVVVFNTVHTDGVIDSEVDDEEKKILERILEPCQINRNPVTKIIHNCCVFKMVSMIEVNIVLREYQLRSRGIDTILDFALYDALVVKYRGVTWHIFDSSKILAIVGGRDRKESIEMVEKSWEIIKGDK